MSIDNKDCEHYKIIQHMLLSKKGLTAEEWARLTGSTKLTTRISELRNDGVEFLQIKEDSKIRKNHFTRYRLKSLKNYYSSKR